MTQTNPAIPARWNELLTFAQKKVAQFNGREDNITLVCGKYELHFIHHRAWQVTAFPIHAEGWTDTYLGLVLIPDGKTNSENFPNLEDLKEIVLEYSGRQTAQLVPFGPDWLIVFTDDGRTAIAPTQNNGQPAMDWAVELEV